MKNRKDEAEEPLIDKEELARRLGISPYSISRIMKEIGFVRVGKRRVLFDPQRVREYISERTVMPKHPEPVID